MNSEDYINIVKPQSHPSSPTRPTSLIPEVSQTINIENIMLQIRTATHMHTASSHSDTDVTDG